MGDIFSTPADPYEPFTAGQKEPAIPAGAKASPSQPIADPFADTKAAAVQTQKDAAAGRLADPFGATKQDAAALNANLDAMRSEMPWSANMTPNQIAAANRAIADSPDPQDVAWRIGTAFQFARMANITPDEALNNLDALSEAYTTRNYEPKTTWRIMNDAWNAGWMQYEMGIKANQWALGGGTDKALEAQLDAMQAKIDLIQEDALPRPWYIDALRGAVGSMPQMITGTVKGAGVAAGVGLAAAGVGLAVGTGGLGTPLAAAAILGGSAAIGTAFDMYQTTQGMAYYQLRKQGHSDLVASGMSALSGFAQAATEGLVESIPVLGTLVGGGVDDILTKAIAKRVAQSGLVSQAAVGITRYGTRAVGEGAEEFWQYLEDIGAQAIAQAIEDVGYEGPAAEEAIRTAGKQFVGGMLAAGILGGGDAVTAFRGDVRQAAYVKGRAKAAMDSGLDYRQFSATMEAEYKLAEEQGFAPVLSEWDDKTREKITKALWARGQKENAEAKAKAEKEAATLPEVDTEGDEAEGDVKRINGRLYTQSRTIYDRDEGTIHAVFKLGDPTAKGKSKRLATIDYEVTGDTVTINSVTGKISAETKKEFILDLMEQHPGMDVAWTPKTEEDQQIYDALVQENPRGPDTGLNWYSEGGSIEAVRSRMHLSRKLYAEAEKMGLKKEQVPVAVAYVDKAAAFFGLSTDDYIKKAYAEKNFVTGQAAEPVLQQTNRGATAFQQAGNTTKALLYYAENADFTTFIHENTHAIVNFGLQNRAASETISKRMAEFEEAFGVKGGNWNETASADWIEEHFAKAKGRGENLSKLEVVAYAVEDYLREGKAPKPELEPIMKRIAQWFLDVYRDIAARVKINPEIRRVFDELFAGDGPLSNKEEAAQEAAPEEALALYQPDNAEAFFEKRNQDLRDVMVQDMTEAQKEEALLTHELTGIPNRRAYAEDIMANGGKPYPIQVSLDADSLKWVNDNMGHHAGDAMLKRIADALIKASDKHGFSVYHVSGDEFIAQGENLENIVEALDDIENELKSVILEEEEAAQDGTKIVLDGVSLSAGFDDKGNLKDADRRLDQEKRLRESEGTRAPRGEVPPTVRVVRESGENLSPDDARAAIEQRQRETEEDRSANEPGEGDALGPRSIRDLREQLRGKTLFQAGTGRAIRNIVYKFPSELKGYSDIHSQNQIEGVLTSFGRGVADPSGKEIRIGAVGTSHAGLASGMADAKRFYYGYSRDRQTVYVVAKNGMDEAFFRKPGVLQGILSQVFDKHKLSVAQGQRLGFYESDKEAAQNPSVLFQTSYPIAGESVSGLTVLEETPNMKSISATLENYKVLKGIREIPMAEFPGASPRDMFYSKGDTDRVAGLSEQIKKTKEIKPLIVVTDGGGPYILEGAHRLAALNTIGVKTFPAVVVEDLSEAPQVLFQQAGDIDSPRILFQAGIEPASKDLLAVHNISEKSLAFAAKTGGIAMPSMAIINKGIPFTNYGDITLLASKDLIDPRANKAAKVFNADVYSPRYPNITYKVEEKNIMPMAEKIAEALKPLYEKSSNEYYRTRPPSWSGIMETLRDALEKDEIEYLDGKRDIKVYWLKEIEGAKGGLATLSAKALSNDQRERFRAWAEKTFSAAQGEARLFKGYTNAGNRRYAPATIENIYAMMKKESIRGGEAMHYGLPSIRALVAKQYKSLSAIAQDKKNIVSDEDFEKAKEATDALYEEILSESYKSETNSDFGDILAEGIENHAIASTLKEYGFNFSEETLEKINLLLSAIREMPTHYFEAKLTAIVSLPEFAGAVIPTDASDETKAILNNAGIETREYQAGDKEARAAAVQELAAKSQQEILFQPAYHGTPNKFDKFTTEKIGTGEGAQAYGWGLYFAGSKQVAEYYRGSLSNAADAIIDGKPVAQLYDELSRKADKAKGDEADLLYEKMAFLEDLDLTWNYDESVERIDREEVKAWAQELRDKYQPAGYVYKVEIPEDDEYLDWDKLISEQPQKIQDAINEAFRQYALENKDGKPFTFQDSATPYTGKDAYKKLENSMPSDTSARVASETLKSLGIPGIRYLDLMSRDNGEGSYNYVIFADEDVQIVETLYQRSVADLQKDALSFKTWEDFRDFYEATDTDETTEPMSPEEKDEFYKTIFEIARENEKAAAPTKAEVNEEEELSEFRDEIKTDAGLRAYLLDIFGGALDRSFMRDVESVGITDAEEEARYNAMAAAERMVEKNAAPNVFLAAKAIVKGTATKKILSYARGSILNNPTEYMSLKAQIQGDLETAARLKAKAEAPYILDPRWVKTAETLSIAKRRKLADLIRNDKLARKIARGSVTVGDDDLKKHIQWLNEQAKEARQTITEAASKAAELSDTLDTTQRAALKQEKELREYRARLAVVEKRARAYQERQAKIPAKTEKEAAFLKKQIETTEKALAKVKADAKTDAAYLDAMASTIATQKERNRLKALEAERRAAKAVHDEMKHLAAQATKPLGKSAGITLEYKNKIAELQAQLDPAFRTAKTLEKLDHWRDFLVRDPGAEEIMPPELIKRIQAKPLNDWTIDELRQFKDKIDALRTAGSTAWKIRHGQETHAREMMARGFIEDALAGEEYHKPVGGVKPTGKGMKVLLSTLRPLAIFQMLDGGKRGAFTKYLWDQVNAAWGDKMARSRDRVERVTKKMEELGFTLDILNTKAEYVGREMTIEGFTYDNGKRPTLQEVLFWSIGMQNEETARAITQGCNIPEQIIEKGIAQLSEKEKALAAVIQEDFDGNYDRLREAFEYNYNMPLGKVDHYVPMRRLEVMFETRGEEVAVGLVSGTGQTKTFIKKGFTKNRKEISPDYQAPIRMDLVTLWRESVDKEEAFIAEDWMIKRLQDTLNRPPVARAIQQRLGPDGVKWIKKYLNDIAQGDTNQALTGSQKFMQQLRGHMAVSYLSFNLLSAMKQLVSPLPYLADAGRNPLEAGGRLFASAAQYLAGIRKGKDGKNAVVDFVESRSELIRNRSISRDFEDVKRIEAGPQASEALRKAVALEKKIGTIGMQGLEIIDHISVCIGWKAVYDAKLAQGMSELEAATAADDATVLTQPSGRVQDLAEIYRSGETMKFFTMFTNALNAQWQMLAYRIPAAIRNKEYMKAVGDAMALALCGLGIALASGAAYGDDDEEKRKKLIVGLFSQYSDSIPLVGSIITSSISQAAGVKTYASEGVNPFPWGPKVINAVGAIADMDVGKAVSNILEGTALAVGLPVSGPKRIGTSLYDTITKKDLEYLAGMIGWKKEKGE